MSSNERELKFRITGDGSQVRSETASVRNDIVRNFSDVERLGRGALAGLNHEIVSLAHSVPLIGQPLAGITRAFLGLRRETVDFSGAAVGAGSAVGALENRITQALRGNQEFARSFATIGIDMKRGILDPQNAFVSLSRHFNTLKTDTDRLRFTTSLFGQELGAKLIPQLETAGAKLAVMEEEAASMGGGLAAAAGPIGIAVAAIVAVTAATAAMAAVVFKASESWSEYGDSIFKAMQKTGQSAEQLSVIKFATEELKRSNAGTSISFDQVVRGIARFEANVSRSVTNPSRQAAQALTALGLSAQALKNMTPDEAFRTMMARLDDVKNRMDRDRAASDLFGKDFQNLIPIMDALGKHFDDTKMRAEAMGVVFTGKSAAQARQFQQTLQDLRLAGTGLAVAFGSQVGPEVTKALRTIMTVTQALAPVVSVAAKLVGGYIAEAAGEIQGLVIIFRAIPPTVELIKNALGVAARAFANLGETVKLAGFGLWDFAKGDYAAAAVNFSAATQKAMTVGREAVKQATEDFAKYRQQIKDIARDVLTAPRMPEIATGDDDVTFPTKQKKNNAAEKARREAIRVLEEEQQQIEEDYKRHTEVLQREYEQLLISSQTYTKGIIDEAETRLKGLEAALEKEKALAKKQSERDDIENKIQKARDDKEKTVEQAKAEQYKREIEALQKHRETLLDLGDRYDEMATENVRARAEANAISYEAAENLIYEIQTKAFDKRLEALSNDEAAFYARAKDINDVNLEVAQDYSDRIAALVAEQERREREHYVRVEEMRRKDLERQREYLDQLFDLEKRYREGDQNQRQREIDNALQSPFTRQQVLALSEQLALETTQINARQRIAERKLDNERDNLKAEYKIQNESIKGTKEYNETLLGIDESYAALRRQVGDKADDDRRDALKRANEGLKAVERQNPLSARSLFGDRYADISETFGPLAAAIDSIKTNALEAFAQMGAAFGSMVEQWVLTGQLGAGGVRGFVASALASLSKMFVIQSLAELAYGFAALTPWGAAIYGPAPFHFKASALLGAAGAIAGVVGRQVAGNTFASLGSGGGSGKGAGTGEVSQSNDRTFNYGGQSAATPASGDLSGGSRGGVGPMVMRLVQRVEEAQKQNAVINAKLDKTLSRIQSMPHGEALALGAEQNPSAIGQAVIKHSGADAEFVDTLARNMRVG
jgi:hypothetical protein